MIRLIKIGFYLFLVLLLITLWPVWMLVLRFRSAWTSAISSPEDKFKMKGKRDEDLVASARAQMLEVAIESSFQPILQLYILFPVLLMQLSCPLNDFLRLFSIVDVLSTSERIQFWSIVTSIVSLSWSFNHYQVVQKNGALNFSSNPIGRLILFFANLLQITSRLFGLILYAYTFGRGNFWPMIVTVLIHILIMATLHYLTCDESEIKFFGRKWHKIIYHCILNGICNLYLHNLVHPIQKGTLEKQKIVSEEHGTIFRQTMFDTIFVVESGFIFVLTYLKLEEYLPVGVMSFIMVCQCLGIFLKWIYYYKYHVWKNTFSHSNAVKRFKESARICCSRITIGKKLDCNNEKEVLPFKSTEIE